MSPILGRFPMLPGVAQCCHVLTIIDIAMLFAHGLCPDVAVQGSKKC